MALVSRGGSVALFTAAKMGAYIDHLKADYLKPQKTMAHPL